jgi:DNA sulfur modification protein DndE
MLTPPRIVRLSAEARERLIRLKRQTKVMHWNVLCRWALCRSLADPSPVRLADSLPAPDSRDVGDPAATVEMTWQVFAGPWSDVLWALVIQRAHEDGLPADDRTVADALRAHLQRGIATLAAQNFRCIEDLVGPALAAQPTRK